MHMNDNCGLYIFGLCPLDHHVSSLTVADILMKLYPYVKHCDDVSYKNYNFCYIALVAF